MSCGGCRLGLSHAGGLNRDSNKVKINIADQVAGFLADKLVAGSGISFNILNPGGDEQLEISSTGGAAGLTPILDVFSPAAAQTVFTLSQTPLLPGTVEMWVDGVAYINGIDFSVALNVATWMNVDFVMTGTETVMFLYKKSGGSAMSPALDSFSATAGQTAFTLSNVPPFPDTVIMFVNGQAYVNGVDFGVVIDVVTWNNVDFSLALNDKILFIYDQSGGSILTQRQDNFTATAGQTSFTLSHLPVTSGAVEMYVNGIAYVDGTDFTVVGTTVTWLAIDFSLANGDKILFVYDF